MYFGILLMWQTQWSSERFLAGIVPCVYFLILSGIEGILSLAFGAKGAPGGAPGGASLKARLSALAAPAGKPSRARNAVVWASAAIIVLSNVVFAVSYVKKQNTFGPDWKNFYSCADWMRTNTPKTAIVMNRKVELFFIRSQRAGVMYPYSHDVNKVMDMIDSSRVDYVVFDNFAWTATTRQYLYPVIESFQNRFQMVYALNNPPTAIYKVIR
jgi:hypothetical protein